MKMNFMKTLMASALCLAFTSNANAQFAFGGDGPIEVDADRIEYDGSVTVLTGQVQVVQADVRILADKMNLYRSDIGGGQLGDVTKIDAIGSFYYITPLEKVRGERGIYERDLDRFTVTGDVILEDNAGNIGTGTRLIYNLTTKEALLQGDCKGRRCDNRPRLIIDNSTGR